MRQDRKKLRKSPNKWNEEVGANILSTEPEPLGMIKKKQFNRRKTPMVVAVVNDKTG